MKRCIHKNAFENIFCEMAAILSNGDELKMRRANQMEILRLT